MCLYISYCYIFHDLIEIAQCFMFVICHEYIEIAQCFMFVLYHDYIEIVQCSYLSSYVLYYIVSTD